LSTCVFLVLGLFPKCLIFLETYGLLLLVSKSKLEIESNLNGLNLTCISAKVYSCLFRDLRRKKKGLSDLLHIKLEQLSGWRCLETLLLVTSYLHWKILLMIANFYKFLVQVFRIEILATSTSFYILFPFPFPFFKSTSYFPYNTIYSIIDILKVEFRME